MHSRLPRNRAHGKVIQNAVVEEGKYVEINELDRLIAKNPEKFTPNAILVFEEFARIKGLRF